jgi:hypothetical protein
MTGFPPRHPGFLPRPGYLKFEENKMAVGQGFVVFIESALEDMPPGMILPARLLDSWCPAQNVCRSKQVCQYEAIQHMFKSRALVRVNTTANLQVT